MPIESAEALFQAFHATGLFAPEQLRAVVRELTPLGSDPQALLRHLIQQKYLTSYQARKVFYGKAHELVIGDYVVSDKLGEGGMGKVYRARQVRHGREVAIKVVRPALVANPTVRRRYEREVAATRSLSHPNIVTVYDDGEAGGRYFLAMEFVDGIDLARMVRDYQPLEVVEACEYVRQAALGLQHAHESGFVHRDVKPSNIVVAGERYVPQATEPAVVKVLDLGLVRSLGIEFGENLAPDLTRAGTVVGTPDYMAPEQAKNSSTVDHRADIYALGGTLYFLIAGRPPFPEGSPVEKLIKHQMEDPPPLRSLRGDVPREVDDLVARMMEKNPADRYRSAAEAADALAALAAYPPGTGPVPVSTRRKGTAAGRAPASGGSTVPPVFTPASASVPRLPAPPVPDPPPAVAPSDRTPGPVALAAPLHAGTDPSSPFAVLNDPPSGTHKAGSAHHRRLAEGTGWVWAGVAVVVVGIVAITLWLLAGSTPGKTTPTQPASKTRSGR